MRLPPVRLIRQHVECDDIWNIFRINVRSSDLIEMDMRSLVIGAEAAALRVTDPSNTAIEFKRQMGTGEATRFPSSGKGEEMSPLRRPASRCTTGMRR